MRKYEKFITPVGFDARIIITGGAPWFVGREVAEALGYPDPDEAVERHVADVDKKVSQENTPSGKQMVTFINESGLYSLIFSSTLRKAQQFTHMITAVMLPQLRETGRFIPSKATSEKLMANQRYWETENAHRFNTFFSKLLEYQEKHEED